MKKIGQVVITSIILLGFCVSSLPAYGKSCVTSKRKFKNTSNMEADEIKVNLLKPKGKDNKYTWLQSEYKKDGEAFGVVYGKDEFSELGGMFN